MLRISVITICFNNPEDLKPTFTSVDMQLLKPYEHIVIDGSTKPDIKNYLDNNPQPPYRSWLCERDKGVPDAWNKGIRRSTGDVCYLLNSGDKIADETVLKKVTEVFEKDSSIAWCHGKLNLMRGGLWVAIGRPFDSSKLYRGMRVMHPTMYVRRELYTKHGLFDLTIKYSPDYDFLCRIANEKSAFIDYPLATFDPNGVSTVEYLDSMKECFGVYRKHFGPSLKQTLWGWRLTVLHYLLQSNFGKFLYRLKVKMGKENA